jgi:hypothetical protein
MAALVNDLGTGSPNLTMKLTAWGGSWKDKYDLNYKSQGNVPGGDPGQGNTTWSAWNVFDEKNNYYGTITLHSDGKDSIWMGPDAYKPDGGNRNRLLDFTLEGIGTGIYGLWVQSVFPSFPFAPLAKPAVDPRTQHPIVLRTQGAKIVNDRGADVVLKGLTRPSLEWPIDRLPGYYGEHLSQKDIEFTRGWGANVIRIPLNQTFWKESAPREVIGSYKQIVDAMIYYAIEQKMAVILDLHRIVRDDQGQMANKQSIDFWKDVAKTYATFGTVLFELFNEPHDITKEQWLSGDGTYAGYQQLYDAVRGAGANNLCIVGGLDWAYDLSFVNSDFGVKGTGIVYCSHPYYRKGNDSGDKFSPASNFAGVLGKFPVILTEFGGNLESTYQKLDYYTQVISYVNTNGFHYTGWAWWVKPDQPWFPCLIGDWSGGAINGGTIVKEDLRTHPGKGIG